MTEKTVAEDNTYPSTSSDDNSGLTKREYFAAIALQGLLSNPEESARTNNQDVARKAVFFADKLIAELNDEQKHGAPENPLPYPPNLMK